MNWAQLVYLGEGSKGNKTMKEGKLDQAKYYGKEKQHEKLVPMENVRI